METAQQALRDSASSLKWREDPDMYKGKGCLWFTAPHNREPPIARLFDSGDWALADEEEGVDTSSEGELRSLTILLMSGYADAIIANEPGTAEHLVATFDCGLVC